jgi:hypothetical protein
VFLGDSLTAGLGLPESDALPALIQRRLDAAGLRYRAINAGRSGDTTAGGLSRLAWYFREGVQLKVLVIGLGSNDAMRGLSLEALADNLTQIIQRTRQHEPDAKIVLWALETFPNLGPEYARQYAAVFPSVAEREHVTFTIAEDLNFDVTRGLEIFLEKHAAAREVAGTEALHRIERFAQRVRVLAHAQADAAASGRALDVRRQPLHRRRRRCVERNGRPEYSGA